MTQFPQIEKRLKAIISKIKLLDGKFLCLTTLGFWILVVLEKKFLEVITKYSFWIYKKHERHLLVKDNLLL